jgi:pimeloyl-ACP methyl ester carboxylesterase
LRPEVGADEDGRVKIPKTRYARTSDGVHIAYQVAGDGPIDLVLVASGLGLSQIWRGLRTGSFLERLASFSRLILLDRRGTGFRTTSSTRRNSSLWRAGWRTFERSWTPRGRLGRLSSGWTPPVGLSR